MSEPYDRESAMKQLISTGLTKQQAKSIIFYQLYGMGASKIKVKMAEMRNSKLKTLTQYTTKPISEVEARMLDLDEAMKMSVEQLDEHFENVAKQSSYNHIITCEVPTQVSHSGWVVHKHKRVAKRYRKPGRC